MANNKLVAVTGCAGFIGSHLTEKLLSEGFKVIGIDNFNPYYDRSLKERNISSFLNDENFTFFEEDITNCSLNDLFKGVSTVYHLAAQAGVRYSWENFQQYVNDNIIATQKVLESCIKNNSKLVFASSSSVYGNAELPEKEDSSLNPISPYALTKEFCEKIIKIYHDTFGINAAISRYFTVYGPRQRPDMAIHIFTKKILNGEEIKVFGDGSQMRDFTYVTDIVNATYLAGINDSEFEIFNVGTGNTINLSELITLIGKETGNEPKINYLKNAAGDVRNTQADISKAKKILGYSHEFNFEEGLKLYVDWYKKEANK